MSYRVKYRVEFFDQLGREKRVDVLELGYSGSIEVVEGSGDPLRIGLQNSADEKYETLQPTYIELTVLAKIKFKFEEIAGGTDKQYKMEVWEDGSLKHVGFIIPQIYQEPYEEPPFPVTFRAVSMGILNRTRYLDSNGDFFTGKVSAMTVITRCLDRLGYGLDIWDSANTYESRMNSASTDSPLTQVQIDQEAYIVDDRGEQRAMYCWDVLEAVLKPFVVNFFQDYGRWVIIPIEERASARTVRVFNSSGVFQSSHSRNPSDDILWIERGHTLQPRPIIREVESEYQHRIIPDLIRTGGFNDDFNDPDDPQFGGLPERWSYSNPNDFIGFSGTPDGTTLFAPLRFDDGGPGALQMVVNPVRPPQNSRWIRGGAFIEYIGDELTPGDQEYVLSLKFRYRVCAPGTTGPRGSQVADRKPFRQRIQVRIGNQYLGADGSMETSPTDIEIEDLTTARTEEVYTTMGLLSDMTNAEGLIRVRIYRPEIEGVFPSLENKGEDVDFAKYPFISLDYLPDGEDQPESAFFIGERDVESFAEEAQYPVIHGDGPTNLHSRSFLIGDSRTENWQRGVLTGSITEIGINEILREYEARSNVIQGRHRVESLFDRYFAEFGEAYVPLSGVYHERMAWFDGQVIQIQAGDIQGTVREYTPRRSGSTDGGTGSRNVRPDVDRLQAVGEITRDYEEESADTLDCLLDVPVRKGIEYWVVNEAELSRVNRFDGVYPVVPQTTGPSGNRLVPSDANYDDESNIREYGPGLLEDPGVPIQVQTINAPAGSLIYKAPGQDEIEQFITEVFQITTNVELTSIDQTLTAQASSIFQLETTVSEHDGEIQANASAILGIESSIDDLEDDVSANASAVLQLDTRVTSNEGGISANASAILSVESEITDLENDIDANANAVLQLDSEVQVIDGEISTLKSTAVLKAQVSSGEITRLAFVSLEASAGSGSAITLGADQITFQTELMTVNTSGGDVIIGNNLVSERANTRQVLIGMNSPNLPIVEVRSNNNNYVQMVGRSGGSDPFLKVVADGDTILSAGRDGVWGLGVENNYNVGNNGLTFLLAGGKLSNPERGLNWGIYNDFSDRQLTITAIGPTASYIYIGNPNGDGLRVQQTGDVVVEGHLSKGSGSFRIPHPNPEKSKTHELFHSFVESPNAGDNIYRFTVEVTNGTGVVNLPDYFWYLNENPQSWIDGQVREKKFKKKTFSFNAQNGSYNVLIIATRKDDKAMEGWKGVERRKS